MKLFYLVVLLTLHFASICIAQQCQKLRDISGNISTGRVYQSPYYLCWIIQVPEESYVRLDFNSIDIISWDCSNMHIEITVADSSEEYIICTRDKSAPIIALNDVTVTLNITRNYGYSAAFSLNYNIVSLTCTRKNNFRCSSHFCIHENKVCDGVKDCDSGIDETDCEKEIDLTRKVAALWLKNQRTASFGWGSDTPRAITALYLSGDANFHDGSLEDDLMAKQLELQLSIALLRNSTNPLSVIELSMFINALLVTCHNPREFYGNNLLKILGERVNAMETLSPGAYLTLCNGNWTISRTQITSFLKVLRKHSGYPFHLDIQAMAMLALSCIKNKEISSSVSRSIEEISTKFVRMFLSLQQPDGSFGNVYTTALVTQALLSAEQKNIETLNMTSTLKYLEQHLNLSSIDFLSAYLTLPVFNNKSLAHIAYVNCRKTREQDEEDEIFEVIKKLGGKMQVKYSFYIGDEKDIIYSIYLKMAENSTAYEVMRMAQMADPRYKFMYSDVSGHMYIYNIGGFTNDPEVGKFWLLYSGDSSTDGTIQQYKESPDRFVLGYDDHLIMWYKTTHIPME